MLGEAVKSCKVTDRGGADSRIGFIADLRVTADVAVLSERKLVVADVDLRRVSFIAPYSLSDTSHYILFGGSWIGTVSKCVSQLYIARHGKFR